MDSKYMRRALQLARNGELYAHPNPMVGAVIVGPDGTVIGEGYHRRCGEGHAEVNAVASVRERDLLPRSTMYVTLEPCAHYGRTGPCSLLIIQQRIPRVVVGSRDPFAQVDGRGIDMLRQAGVEVTVGVMEHECRSLNAAFFTAHTEHRPFVCLKWAQTADGWMDSDRHDHPAPAKISTPTTQTLMHRWRARFDAIMVGSGTVLADDPMLDTRLWPGPSPQPIILDRRRRVGDDRRIMSRQPIIVSEDKPMPLIMADLYRQGITSVLVEGGPTVLNALIQQGLWDIARVETGSLRLGSHGSAAASTLPAQFLQTETRIGANSIKYYSQNPLFDVKNI